MLHIQLHYVLTLMPYDACNVAIIFVAILPPTNVRATVLSSRSVMVTWMSSQSTDVTSYIISYTATASFSDDGSVTVNGGSTTSDTLTNLEEGTLYTIIVRATDNDNRMSANNDEVSVTTYTAGK